MGRKLQLRGQRFDRLLVICESGSEYGNSKWLCQCDCGKQTIVSGGRLRAGEIRSCGCLRLERTREVVATHGESRTRLYRIWQQMKQRCANANFEQYADYGGRGISICTEWLESFESFRDWANSNGYRSDLTIDRINVDGNYEPSNCRWASAMVQNQNKRTKKGNNTGYSGVTHLPSGRYCVNIGANCEKHYLGTYDSLTEAVQVRKEGEAKYWNSGA